MPKNFARDFLCAVFQISSGSEKDYEQEGEESQDNLSNFFLSDNAEISRMGEGNPLVFY